MWPDPTETLAEFRSAWNDRAIAMQRDLDFERRFLYPFAYAPALFIARTAGLGRSPTPLTLSTAAMLLNLGERPTVLLLDLLEEMELLEGSSAEGWCLTDEGRRLLDPQHATEFIQPVMDFLSIVATGVGKLASQTGPSTMDWPPSTATAAGRFEGLMTATAPYVAAWLDELISPLLRGRILDVGGGDGTVAAMLCKSHPELAAVVYNLPVAGETVEARIRDFGLAARMKMVGGDFRVDDLPADFEIVLFSRMLSDWDDDLVLRLLHLARASIAEAGRVIVVESDLAEAETTSESEHPWALFWELFVPGFGLHGSRSLAQWDQLARATGFSIESTDRCGRLPFPKLTALRFAPA